MYYVYHLIDPRSGDVFYVGKGIGRRIHAHDREARRGGTGAKCDRIRAIWQSGLQVGKKVVREFGDESAAYAFEKREIERFGLAKLCNAVRGAVPDLSCRQKGPKKVAPEVAAEMLCGYYARVLPGVLAGRKFSAWQAALIRALGASIKRIEQHRGRAFIDEMLLRAGYRISGSLPVLT